MKTDEIPFTFVTAIVLAGALLAVVSPSKPDVVASTPAAKTVVAHTNTAPIGNPAAGEGVPATETEITE